MTFLCIGHRGASGHAPENTLKAFDLAIDMGCPWIELDVYCVEAQLLVIHDDDVDRTTDGQGEVMQMSFAALRKLDAGDGQKIPTLQEVLDLVDKRANINIELKGPNTALPVNQLLDKALTQGWKAGNFLISSFHHRELARSDPKYPRAALFHKELPDALIRCQKLGAVAINLARKITHPAIVAAAHREGLKVYVYTVNTHEDMLALKEIGVDGVFTNFPDLFPSNQFH